MLQTVFVLGKVTMSSTFLTSSPLILTDSPKKEGSDEEIPNVRAWNSGWMIGSESEVDTMRLFSHESALELHIKWPRSMGCAYVRLQTSVGKWYSLSKAPFRQSTGCTFNMAHLRAFRLDFPETNLFTAFYSPDVSEDEQKGPDFGTK